MSILSWPYTVEYRFRFLKSPYFVGPVYLQNNDRVEAFGCLMLLMAVILYATFEYRIRTKMQQETEPLLLPGKRKSMRPTGTSVLEMFDRFAIALIPIGDRVVRKGPRGDAQIQRILAMLGTDMSVYGASRETA